MPPSTYIDGLRLLGRRELSVSQLRARLLDREHQVEDVDSAIARLLETRALDDSRVELLVQGAVSAAAMTCSRRGANPPRRRELPPTWPTTS